MSFAQAFWLWLIPLALWLAWKYMRVPGPDGALRMLLVILACLLLAAPSIRRGGRGMDVIVVLDESLSIPEKERQEYRELVQSVARNSDRGDRVGIIRFGATTRVEKRPEDPRLPGAWADMGRQNRSDLLSGVESAMRLVPEERAARLVVVTDGEFSTAVAEESARLAATRGIPLDVWRLTKPDVRDVAVYDLEMPSETRPGEPFQFTAWLQSTAPSRVTYELRRNGNPIARHAVQVGMDIHPVLLRDVLQEEGVHHYELVIRPEGIDRVPENNRARSVVICRSRATALLVTRQPGGTVARLLAANQIPHEVVGPGGAATAVRLENLNRHSGLILENINAEVVGNDGMLAVQQFVQTFGGGLVMTGGRESFGVGGYFKSPVEDCLPVTLDVRKDIRKSRMSLVITMDRSGSMGAPVGSGLTKMDLANHGTIEAIRMLGPMDRIGVIVGDTQPHIIVPLSPVEDTGKLIDTVRRLRSMGGGIYVYDSLVASYEQLIKSDTAVRHLILFSDAADTEQPGDYVNLLRDFRAANITVSVIGLGTERDVDADLLIDIARLGNGRIFFTEDAEELPRLFSYETMLADRSAYAEVPATIQPTAAGLSVLRAIPEQMPEPALLGYNIGYVKPTAQTAWMTRLEEGDDDNPTALWAFGNSGVGRSVALLFDVNGPDAAPLQAWDGFGTVLGSAIRWALDAVEPDAALDLRRDGHDLVAVLDVEPSVQPRLIAAPILAVYTRADGRTAQQLPMRQEPDGTWQARLPLEDTGLYHAAVHLGELGVVRAAPVAVLYSAEYRLWSPARVQENLRIITEGTGGIVRTQFADVFRPAVRKVSGMDLRPLLAALLLVGWVVEISMRRLSYGQSWPSFTLHRIRLPKRLGKSRSQGTSTTDDHLSPAIAQTSGQVKAPETADESILSSGVIDAMKRVKRGKNG